MGWLSSLLAIGAKALAIYQDWRARRTQAQHDAEVRADQQRTDALQGEKDAIEQNDRVNSALDAGGVPIANDPANLDR